MDRKFIKYGKAEVFRNRDLLADFLKEYQKHFGSKLNPSCSSCRGEYWNNYINLNIETMECKYRLKAKYNGVTMMDKVPILNGEMTDEKAKELLLWHPAHELLFDVLPDEVEIMETVDNVSEIVVKQIPKKNKDLKLSELREKYPDIKANSKQNFLNKI